MLNGRNISTDTLFLNYKYMIQLFIYLDYPQYNFVSKYVTKFKQKKKYP